MIDVRIIINSEKLTCKGDEGMIWGFENTLYLDLSDHYMGMVIFPNSSTCIVFSINITFHYININLLYLIYYY